MSKSKRMARNYHVPQSQAECDDMIFQLGEVRRQRARIEADMNDQLAKTKERYETKAAPYREKAEDILAGIETWCAANRDSLTQNGKVKFAHFKNGDVKWRTRPPRVRISGVEAVLQKLKDLGLRNFIRTKEEINKDAILENPDHVIAVAGITIGSEGEDFVVEPFEQELNPEKAA